MNAPARLRVLLIDDNPHDRGLVIRHLRQHFEDVETRQVLDQAELDRALAEGPFDVVITDYQLRWSDGLSVLKEVKSRFPNCPVIMFTATGNEEVAVAAMKRGLDDYVIKKLQHLSRLPIAISGVIEKSLTRRRVEQLQSQLDDLLSRLGMSVFRCSVDGELIDSNAALRRLLRAKSFEEAREKWPSFVAACGLDLSALSAGLSPDVPYEIELTCSLQPEAPRHLRFTLTAGHLPDTTQVVEGVIEDETARKRAEEEQRALGVGAERLSLLTPREYEVFEAVVAGHANKVTARQLHITEKTVEKHRARIMKKLGARSVADLVRMDVFAKSERR